MRKCSLSFGVLLVALLFLSLKPAHTDYVSNLKSLYGTSYLNMNCQQFIEAAASKNHCGAEGMWNGCLGQAHVIKEFNTREKALQYPMMPGDVMVFHKFHVAVYIDSNRFMDSDPLHDGVGYTDLLHKSPYDYWFQGPVRIVRWNQ